jgi:predicted double-glycine peptidase
MITAPRFSASRYLVFIMVAYSCCTAQGIAAILFISTPNVILHIPVISSHEARFRFTIKQERDYSCGSAAVATLLTYHYHFPVDEHDVFNFMYQNGDQKQIRRYGFSLLDMKYYLEAKGFRADGFRLPLDELAKIGVPAITLINDDGYNHFVVIKGIAPNYILLGDPARGTRAMSRSRFEKIWNGLAFVIRNKRDIASAYFNRDEEWQVVGRAPLNTVLPRQGIAGLLLSLPGPYEF